LCDRKHKGAHSRLLTSPHGDKSEVLIVSIWKVVPLNRRLGEQRNAPERERMTDTRSDLSIVAIIPLYNGARWIEQTIGSVLSQTRKPDEFIVVDDGSTDDGLAVVERLAREHRITLLRKTNGGQSAARNYAVAHSKSALIALLDQDDIWHPRHLEALVEVFTEHKGPPLGWVYSDFDDIDHDGKMVSGTYVERPRLENPKRHLHSILQHGVIIQPSATLISRAAFEAVGGFDERLCGYEDDDLFLRMFREGFANAYVPYSTSQWRIHPSSCGASDRHDNSLRLYIRKLLDAFPDDLWRGHYYTRDMIAPRFINIWLLMYVRASRYKNHAKMREYVEDALALVPLLRPMRKLLYATALPLMRFPLLGNALLTMREIAQQVLLWISAAQPRVRARQ
jgi:glycosyltransferase involved in cell wall biosynthesis